MLRTVKYPDPILTTKCALVVSFDKVLHDLLDGMREHMKLENGIGLAANQVGYSARVFVMEDQKKKVWEFINPEIVERDGHQAIDEGCLSAPGVSVQVPRAQTVMVKAFDRSGNEFKVVCEGIEAVCIQHEIDHLDGIFFLEKTSRNQRRAALRSLGLK